MAELIYTWHKIDLENQGVVLESNTILTVEVPGKKICLTKYNEVYYAFSHTCPHAGGIMANGTIDGSGNVVCPIHKFKFSIKNGRNISGEGYYLKTYPVEIRDTGIFVGLK